MVTAKWHGGLAGIYNTYTQGRGTRHIRQSCFRRASPNRKGFLDLCYVLHSVFSVKSIISRHILARSGFLVLVFTSIRTLFISRDHRRPASRFELGRSSHGPNISFNHPRSP